MQNGQRRVYSFDSFTLDLSLGCLLREGHEVKLRPKSFVALTYLIENSGRLISKDELLHAIWPDSFVTDDSLVKCLKEIRLALSDDTHQLIKTVPRRGYIFSPGVVASRTAIYEEQTEGLKVTIDEEVETAPTTNSIAVLPFQLLDGDDKYLGLGLADALITRFCKLRRIIVRPTGTVIQYANKILDPLVAAKELDVNLLLEGSIQRSGDKIRVSVRLLRVCDGSPLWADKLDEKAADIFNLQDSISEKVAEAVSWKLTREEKDLLIRRYTEVPEAYQLYLKGRYFWNQMTEESLKKAIGYFEQAIASDPQYAMAYAGIADSYIVLGAWATGALAPREAYPKAKVAALKALECDYTLAEAHTSMAAVIKVFDWNWAEAEKGFKRAIELDPSYPTAHQWYAMYLNAMGRLPEAIEEIKRAHGLAPLSHVISRDLSRVFFFAREYESALKQLEQTLEMEPNFVPALFFQGTTFAQLKRFDESVSVLQRAVTLTAGKAYLLAALGHTYAISGERDQAMRIIDELREQAKRRYVSPYNFAIIYAGLGESDQAFTYLERTYEERANWLVFLRGEARLDCLRSDARFADLMRRVGLMQ